MTLSNNPEDYQRETQILVANWQGRGAQHPRTCSFVTKKLLHQHWMLATLVYVKPVLKRVFSGLGPKLFGVY